MTLIADKKYSPKEIGLYMGVNRLTIYQWYKKGKIFLHVNPLNNYFWLYGRELEDLYKRVWEGEHADIISKK